MGIEQKEIQISQPIIHRLTWNVPIRSYFEYLDTVVSYYDRLLSYPISEHLVVRANPWIIDTLENTDYYRLMDRGIFHADPQSLIALRKGQLLVIPNKQQVDSLTEKMAATLIDVNIPEYKLRIYEGDRLSYTFPVRVGRNAKKFLAMAGRTVDLRTKTGTGKIVRIERDPVFINPTNNKRYSVTRRDDQKVTKLPRIPWLEPELNGIRYGHLIHPTTNPVTLGQAYSNGCVGMREADLWRLYYHAPLNTQVVFRYDLEVLNDAGDSIRLKDIYQLGKSADADLPIAGRNALDITEGNCACYCYLMD